MYIKTVRLQIGIIPICVNVNEMIEIIVLLKLIKFNSTLFASSAGFMKNSYLLLQYY